MKRIVLFLILSPFVALLSCQPQGKKETNENGEKIEASGEKEKQNALYKEVMAIHDEVMPLMGDLMAMNKKIKSQDSASEEATALSVHLEEANEAMMNWMRKFNPNIENMTHEETMNYLEEERTKITEVRKKMLSAQEQATAFLQE